MEQTLNPRILYEKYLQHQQNLYHVFTDFKKNPLIGYGMQPYGPHAEVQYQCESSLHQLYSKGTSELQVKFR